MGTTQRRTQAVTQGGADGTRRPVLLVVEPEALLRWAIATYLGRWFEVIQASSASAADAVIESEAVDALVVSGEIGRATAESVERHAHDRNPNTRVVRTLTDTSEGGQRSRTSACIEKPFRLSDLADLLDVPQRS